MLYWALVSIVFLVIAGALAFGGLAGSSAGIAQILLGILGAFVVISIAANLVRRA